MTIHTAIITDSGREDLPEPVDTLLDTMIEAQRRAGQISWHTITETYAGGDYRTSDGAEARVAVVDLDTTDHDLLPLITLWVTRIP
ncbi:MAG: hypothetical protein E6Q55_28840 [Mycolicibacterium mageritense]|nr:hypothetical protein [Mycolicibacterium mageritense]TXI56475.1 MAG: hypothetical protein E6Q55_28840 [Mycolicibacterium mageritense]